MKPLLTLALCLGLSTPLLAQQAFDPLNGAPPAPEKLVTMTGSVQSRSGDDVRGVVKIAIEKTWHINSATPLDSFLIPTRLSFDAADADLTSAKFPPHTLESFAFSGESKVAVYQDTVEVPFEAHLKGSAAIIHATLHYQSCNNSVCLPPRNALAEISTVATGAVPTPATATTSTAATGFTPLSAAPRGSAAALPNNAVATAFASHGLPLTLLILFLGGLALNLTPCVFPLINITLGFFAMQSDGKRSRRISLSAAYVLGIVITYSILGVVAALSGALFGAWLQHPAVLIGLSVMMLVFAASMFGAWDITVPQFIANRSQGKAGVAGALSMGLLVGIVAAPCVGPVVAGLFALVASIGKPLIGLVMFGALGFGLGFPYLVALNALPRPGEWMVHVKKGMGFVLLAMAVYFLRPLIGEEWFRWGVAGCLLVGAFFLFFVRSSGPRGGRVLRLSLGALLLIAGVAFAIPHHEKGEAISWTAYNSASVAAAAAEHKPVVIDFYADWCIPCKEFEATTFRDPAAVSELGRFTRLKANLTNDQDLAVKALTKEYAIAGVPTLVFIGADGKEIEALRLTGFEKAQPFVDRLKRVH